MSQSPICIVTYRRDNRPDGILRQASRHLLAAGLNVRGLLQDGIDGSVSRCATLYLEDIGTRRRIQIFEKRGAEARGCKLDAAGLAEASGWLQQAIDARPDVLFVNRFGRQEAEGRGLIDEIGSAVIAGIPVVIAVGEGLLPDWRAFAGGEGSTHPAEVEQIVAWALSHHVEPCA